MPLQIVRNDITKMKVDAIVNAANSTLLGGGGVDGAIHRAAGPELLAECKTLGGCAAGEAKITGAYQLPCKYVIHTVGPIWKGGGHGERELLFSCYRTSLELAKENGCETVAFPLISSGAYGYPKDQALHVAVEAISEFLLANDMTVFIVVFCKNACRISEKLFSDIEEYIDDRYVDEHSDSLYERRRRQILYEEISFTKASPETPEPVGSPNSHRKTDDILKPKKHKKTGASDQFVSGQSSVKSSSLSDAMLQLDESFSEMLLRKIDESGMTDAECYKKANIDRRLFSKIRADKFYKPSKTTAIAFAIALELSLTETGSLLRKAGFALSHSNKFDIIIEYFIEQGNYNIFEINEALFSFDQNLLGV